MSLSGVMFFVYMMALRDADENTPNANAKLSPSMPPHGLPRPVLVDHMAVLSFLWNPKRGGLAITETLATDRHTDMGEEREGSKACFRRRKTTKATKRQTKLKEAQKKIHPNTKALQKA